MDAFHQARQLFLEGLSALAQKNLPLAESAFRRSLEFLPGRISTLINLATTLIGLRKFAEAKEIALKVISLDEKAAEGRLNLGIACAEEMDLSQALENFDKAISLKPDYAESHYNRGKVLHGFRRYAEALASYDRALAIQPDYADALNNRGIVRHETGRYEEALIDYEKAVALDPEHAESHFNRGVTLVECKNYPAALQNFDRALDIRSDYDFLHGTRLHTRMHLCDWTNLDRELARLEARIERGERASPPFAVSALSSSARLQRLAAQTWVRTKYPASPAAAEIAALPPHDRIRVGYFSGDFLDHPVAYLTAELFERHDRSRFEVFGFSFGPPSDSGMRRRVAGAFDRFVDVRNRSDLDIAQLSRNLEIDIAVDLGGFTEGARPGIFAARAAPLQASYIGYLGTMGANFMDYLIADATLVPDSDQQHYVEKIVYLPSYQANDTRRPIAERTFSRKELGLPETGFVYCCFNNNFKITPETFDSWMRILKQTEGSVLLLYAGNEWAVANLRQEALCRGIDCSRVMFGRQLPRAEYLARYKTADLFLDTLPYNAGTTASDALWAGLPVLTLMGSTFAGRVAASLLHAIGLPELVTTTREEFERMAVEFASNPRQLTALKQKLAANRTTMPLFDIGSFTSHLEAAYAKMYARQRAGLPAEHIRV